jgi:hypothetical protein
MTADEIRESLHQTVSAMLTWSDGDLWAVLNTLDNARYLIRDEIKERDMRAIDELAGGGGVK